MNTVEPIRDMKKVKDMQDYLKARSERDYVMFMLLLHVPMRISDILQLRVRDVKNKEEINKREQKTGKEQKFPLGSDMRKILKNYIKNKEDHEYLFQSQKGKNKPITRCRAYVILRNAGDALNIPNIGAHSPRKTFGYFYYKRTKDIVVLQELFNHSDIAITKRYIGLNQDIKDKAILSMSFM